MHGIGNFELEESGTIPDLQLAVTTYGTLNEAKDNAIVVPTWFAGTTKTAPRARTTAMAVVVVETATSRSRTRQPLFIRRCR